MKRILYCIVIGLTAFQLPAQPSSKEIKKHRLKVLESKTQNKSICSLDTLFCSGEPIASVRIIGRDSLGNALEQSINGFGQGQSLIQISRLEYVHKPGQLSYLFSFPALDLMCEMKSNSPQTDVYETICRYGLIKAHTLDTLNVETFVVLKGRVNLENLTTVKSVRDTVAPEKSFVVKRDIHAELQFEGENILQNQTMIGSYQESTTESPSGILNKLSVYNALGALICSATETSPMSHEWRLLLYRDNKFVSYTSSTGYDREDIIKYLITQGYL